ncbi:ATP-binding protein [Bauldia litoralis]|uniref:ATP-binding protein n=1 Tax=Bauldia litoralis TaxID=665467 RepID=UPI0032650229
MAGQIIHFDEFSLVPHRGVLLRSGVVVPLGSRAFAILRLLVERQGDLVGKDELLAAAWPDTFVEEGNLRVQIAAIRKALGDSSDAAELLANVPGRGYRFVAPVSFADHLEDLPPDAAAAYPLPLPSDSVLGRSELIDAIADQLLQRRLVTIVGPGGIGKTTIALAVARKVLQTYGGAVAFVDFGPVVDPILVAFRLALALNAPVNEADPIPSLLAFLKDKRMLVVFDTCEHVVEATASLAEAICAGTTGIDILATSREPLRAEGETIRRLPPLAYPDESSALTATEALDYPAVQLFVLRAAGVLDDFRLTDADVPVVVDICRRLDGIALAIELAARRIDAFGLDGLATVLDNRFSVLTAGRRTALPRHQTLLATLDWSYGLLSPPEQAVFRRLSVFVGIFSLETATGVLVGDDMTAPEVIGHLGDLVAKSLVAPDLSGRLTVYRLLDTTRAFAVGKTVEQGEQAAYARRPAEYYRDRFARAEAEWETISAADWLETYAPCIDNVRLALDWAFSPGGDPAVGVALTISAVPLWFQLSLIDESRRALERALLVLDAAGSADAASRMKLLAARGWSLMYTTSPDRETGAAWKAALDLAVEVGDADYQLRALWGLWAGHINNGAFAKALDFAGRFRDVAAQTDDPSNLQIGYRMTGAALHFLGEHREARSYIDRMLRDYRRPIHAAHIVRFQFDQEITARITLSRIQWLTGFPDQAMQTVEANIADAVAVGHTLSLCNALGQSACPVALLSGDLNASERYTTMLRQNTAAQGLDVWRAYADGFEAAIRAGRGDAASAATSLRAVCDALSHARFVQYHAVFLAHLVDALIAAELPGDAVVAAEDALVRTQRTEARWLMPELMRLKAEALSRAGDESGAVDALLCEAAALAEGQDALGWELRIAASRVRQLDRADAAMDHLARIYDRFNEGFGTRDLATARALLDRRHA